MAEPEIRYDDGAAYERYMAPWSRRVGEAFLAWLSPSLGGRWLDVGCGTGAFSALIAERCAPAELQGVDPSAAQLAFARARPLARRAEFREGGAEALPFADDRFDAAVMALVIFFVPDPGKGVAEMARVVRPGGWVATYAWDMLGGGFPLDPIQSEMRALGMTPLMPPSAAASRMEALRQLWQQAGLVDVATEDIAVERTFADFDEFWTISQLAAGLRPMFATTAADDLARLRAGVRARLPADAAGNITCHARANAIKGRVPK